MKKRQLQIDVIGPQKGAKDMIRCNLYYDGRCCAFWTTRANYEALMYDQLFIRDGKNPDSAGVINTTNIFSEEE